MIYWKSWQKNKAKYWAAFDMEAPNVEVARIVRYPDHSQGYSVVSRARPTAITFLNLAAAKDWAECALLNEDQAYTRSVGNL